MYLFESLTSGCKEPVTNTPGQQEALENRYLATLDGLGVAVPRSRQLYTSLARQYSEDARYYHTLDHIWQCLGELDQIKDQLKEPLLVELALWYHDVLYVPGKGDNESHSANWFRCQLIDDLGHRPLATVAQMILHTTHVTIAIDRDTCFLVDIDLSGLGKDWQIFADDSHQLVAEFLHYGRSDYAQLQHRFFSQLLARPSIYLTAEFRQRLEPTARSNIRRYLDTL